MYVRARNVDLFSASRTSGADIFIDANLEAVTHIVAFDTIRDVSAMRSKDPGQRLLGKGNFGWMCSLDPVLAQAY